MKLSDLRKLSVQRRFRIRFRMRNGMECIVTEHGTAQVPGIKGTPDFNLEDELASASEFVLEPAAGSEGSKRPAAPLFVSREELAVKLAASPQSASASDDE